jgi:hypothetical protein
VSSVAAPLVAIDGQGRAHEVMRARRFDLVAVCDARQVSTAQEQQAGSWVWRVRGARGHGAAVSLDVVEQASIPFAKPMLKPAGKPPGQPKA